jgi:hypothetical protein
MTNSFDSHNGTHRTVRIEDTICKHCAKLAFRSLVLHAKQAPLIVSHCRVCGMTSHHPATAADVIHAQELETYRHEHPVLAESA